MAKISKAERMHWKLSHVATALSVQWDCDEAGAYTLDATKVIDEMQELIEFFRPIPTPAEMFSGNHEEDKEEDGGIARCSYEGCNVPATQYYQRPYWTCGNHEEDKPQK